ncbi:MAG: YHS domain-containing protein, partial [Pseudomonadota bacterium]
MTSSTHTACDVDDRFARDPVCGMLVDTKADKPTCTNAGTTYHFCNPKCRDRFVADPERYLDPDVRRQREAEDAERAALMPAADQYGCPMCPGQEQNEPGVCNVCGMALEPMGASSLNSDSNPELDDFWSRFLVGVGLVVPLMLLAMGDMVGLPLKAALGGRLSQFVELVLVIPLVFWCGRPFLDRGLSSIRSGHLNMWTLILIGVSAAFGYSVVATLAPGIFPVSQIAPDGTVGVYFEAAGMIIVLVLLGQILELSARAKTGDALRQLVALTPETANRVTCTSDELRVVTEVKVADLEVGDRVLVKP